MNQYKPNDKLRIYYDAEFTGLHRRTSLISIGLISDSETTFYAEFTDYDQTQVNEWLQTNVIPNLILGNRGDGHFSKSYPMIVTPTNDVVGKMMSQYSGSPVYNMEVRGTREFIKDKLLDWLQNESEAAGKQIQVFTDCYAYDWVLMLDMICQYGDGINIPKCINYIPIDLSTLMWSAGIDPDFNREEFAGPYMTFNGSIKNKHNSLWDAQIAKVCFEKIMSNITVRFN